MNDIVIEEFVCKFFKLVCVLVENSLYLFNVYSCFECILKQIEVVWGMLVGYEYLEILLMMNCIDCQGFDDFVVSELICIYLLYIKYYLE